jgi:hypothetical protein
LLAGLNLNQRQRNAISHLKVSGRIGNPDYRRLFVVSKPTATRDLEELRALGVLAKVGSTGKGTYYVLNSKGLTKGSMDSSASGGFREIGQEPDKADICCSCRNRPTCATNGGSTPQIRQAA